MIRLDNCIGECRQRRDDNEREVYSIPFLSKNRVRNTSVPMSIPLLSTANKRSAGMATRYFSGSNMRAIVKSGSAQIGVENASGVVTTGSGCSPSGDRSISYLDVHGVAGIDVLNQTPANDMGTNRVYDRDKGRIQHDFWSYQDEKIPNPENEAKREEIEGLPRNSGVDFRYQNSQNKKIQGEGKDEVAPRSKSFSRIHMRRIVLGEDTQ